MRWENFDERSVLDLSLSADSIDRAQNYRIEGRRSTIEQAIPIRVRGQRSPQVLTRVYRPNWLDYSIYAFDDDGCYRQFSISVRHPKSIAWHGDARGLESFQVFDRWMPRPAGFREPPGRRWQLVSTWTVVDGRWKQTKKVWSTYVFATDPSGQDYTAKQMPFRWRNR